MEEKLLHYVWQQKILPLSPLKTTDGKTIEIIDAGRPNTNAGPDFLNAKIKIDGVLWVGNIEVHLQTSDWFLHHHNCDKNYDNIILHVVHLADKELFRTSGEKIPQLEISIPKHIEQRYNEIQNSPLWIPCANKISSIDSLTLHAWIDHCFVQRLIEKTERIEGILKNNNNNWEDCFYVTLAHYFGFGLNGYPFELLAKSLPLAYLAKHKNNLLQVEALLFGQSGFLTDENHPLPDEEYPQALKKEYNFLKTKFNLTPIDVSLWKLLRTRPQNFPHIRIAQFAALIHQSSRMFSVFLANPNVKTITEHLSVEPSKYWLTHFRFSNESAKRRKSLGKNAIQILTINVIAPILFLYAQKHNDEELQNKITAIFGALPAEKNNIIGEWKKLQISASNAYTSQALLQLKEHYCNKKDCLRCSIGNKLLKKAEK